MRGSISVLSIYTGKEAGSCIEVKNKRPQGQNPISGHRTAHESRKRDGTPEPQGRGQEGQGGSTGDQDRYRTTLFQKLIRPVPAVPLSITHFPAVHALATLTLKSAGTLTS